MGRKRHSSYDKLHHYRKRERNTKQWLRNTPLKDRGWWRGLPFVEYHAKAPTDLRFLVNTKECVDFFSILRRAKGINLHQPMSNYRIDLSDVAHIDFASTMLLTAIGEELALRGCNLRGNTPLRPNCAKYLKESGFFNNKFDLNGRQFKSSNDSEFITIERGQFRFTKEHQETVRNLNRHVNEHLAKRFPRKRIHTTIIKEICANSSEWSEANKGQWTLGAKFEEDKVVFIALDLGKGILNSLYIRAWEYIHDLLTIKTDAEILFGAFIEKYGSSSQDDNRNRGLPCVKAAFDRGDIKELSVVTNNSMIDFSKQGGIYRFAHNRDAFRGTLYSWRIDKDCL